jgi:hypothetical protein
MPQQITDVSRRGRRSARATRLALASLWLLLPLRAAPASAGQAAEAPAPAPSTAQTAAPALPREQIRQFLETAPIIKGRATVKGVTRPMRVTLSDGTLTHDAAFSTVDEHKNVERFEGGRVELDFVDSYKFSLAAYKIAELVGLDDMMPVHVEREWRGQKGALAWWVDAKMDEGERLKNKVPVPNPAAWNEQMYRMRVFMQLVADTDRNVGNLLIDADWKLWMIDFTRAFRRTKSVLSDKDLKKCDRELLAKLRALTVEQVAAATRPYLTKAEIVPLMARRDQIVKLFDALAARNGEAQVLY